MITISEDKCISCGACGTVCPTHKIYQGESGPAFNERVRCLRCMHCTAACPTQAIHFDFVPTYEEYPDMPEDEFLRLIMTRRSIRNFKDEAPEKEDIAWALDMAQWAPSGKNRHSNQWFVIYGKEKCRAAYNKTIDLCEEQRIMPQLVDQRRKGHHDSVTCGCTAIIMALMPDDRFDQLSGDADAIIAATTAELLLQHMDIGTCWGGYLTFLVNKIPELKLALQVPEGMHVAGTLLCGLSDEVYRNVPWRDHAKITWAEE